MDKDTSNYFSELNKIDVNDKIEKKNGLSYLSWAYAWGELKKRYPDSNYTIYENAQGWNYHTDGRTAWVKTGVTVCGVEHVEELPVMDYRNNSIPLDKITSFDVNKAIQRSLTKAVARHGLGLYIYAGEDLPEEKATAEVKAPAKTAAKDPIADARAKYQELIEYCKENGHDIKEVAKIYNLNSKSTAAEFKTALNRLVLGDSRREASSNNDFPEEV